jgi:hypothetical protein
MFQFNVSVNQLQCMVHSIWNMHFLNKKLLDWRFQGDLDSLKSVKLIKIVSYCED